MTETARGTGKWAEAGVPHKGWTCVGIEDLGSPSATCEMCETQEIRYVHTMTHADYPDELGCGCVCAGRMEEDYEGARRRETVLRVRLIVWCKACQHQVEPDPAKQARRYGEGTSVLDWRDRLVCSRCGSRQVDMVVSGTRRR